MQSRAASTVPASVDEEARTVDLTWSTGSDVQRYDWFRDRPYIERLSMDAAHVDLGRLNGGGAQLLDSHRSYGLSGILGVVERAEVKAGRGMATVRFDDTPEAERAWRSVKNGIIRNISVGYNVQQFKREERKDGMEIRTAIRWEPMEISLVPIPADKGAQVRADEATTYPCDIIEEHEEMPDDIRAADDAATGAEAEVKRAADLAKADLKRMREAEAERVREIHDLGKRGNATGDEIATAIESDVSGGDFAKSLVGRRAAADDDIKTRAPGRVTEDEREKLREGATLALVAKAGYEGGERNEFSSLTLRELARECLSRSNVTFRGLDAMHMIGMAFTTRADPTHSTSDFTAILGNVANKSMMLGYEESEETFQLWTRPGILTDFKVADRVDLNAFPSLAVVEEGATYTYGTVGERKEQIQLATYGNRFSITRQAIINDDLNAFTRIPMRMGRAAIRTVAALPYAILTGSHVMADGNELFSTAHSNYTSSGTAITAASVSLARSMMATQKDRSASTVSLNIRPSFLLVPVAIVDTARVLMDSKNDPVATTLEVPNPVRNLATVIADARLDDDDANAWYLLANPNMTDTVEVAYLDGVRTPTLEQRDGWDVDGVEYKVRMDAGAKAIAWEGMYKNEGA